ncbi:hypothetical protein SAMN04487926_11943 [Paraburkholderia steynii]|uniref:Uncharacterized protein n=1 Tax=Paraburkholderia steynii TaxID=1245441 RepID=A0A7Z7FJJ2_9BURK|nr:hypothetical protein SAMN04487926_11943 [Paraburkholderia steynii]
MTGAGGASRLVPQWVFGVSYTYIKGNLERMRTTHTKSGSRRSIRCRSAR